jgi:hypothetical protein
MSEKAKFVAKQTLSPCYGNGCMPGMMNLPLLPPYSENKIFPEEVENVNSYLKEPITRYN